MIAVEPAACPSLTRGQYAYDFGDTARLTPLVKMHTLGSTFVPPGFHAGGLRYHGMAPLVSHLEALGLVEARAYHQTACFAAGVEFARAEGIVPAPEANHAVRAAIDEALRCKAEEIGRAILFNLSGHGHFDMQAYSDYLAWPARRPGVRRAGARDGAGGAPVGAADRRGVGLGRTSRRSPPRWPPSVARVVLRDILGIHDLHADAIEVGGIPGDKSQPVADRRCGELRVNGCSGPALAVCLAYEVNCCCRSSSIHRASVSRR